MLIEIILFIILGIFLGTITGLIPGIHTNLVGILLVSISSTILFNLNPIFLITLISSMAITHTFIDFIPSVFLGCPDTDTELSILPGHDLLKKGLGYEAIALTAYGSLTAIILLMFLAFPSAIFLKKIEPILETIIPGLLILASMFLISSENKKLKAIFVFLTTGILGLIVLNLEIKEPLLPLLTGLFGASGIIISIKEKFQIPKQFVPKKIKTKILRPILGSVIASPLCSFLPGLGSGQAAIIGNSISKTDKKGFLVLLGATNTFVMGFSFIALYAISRTRTGAAFAINEIFGNPSPKILILILATSLITGIISFFITLNLAKFFSRKINKINYTKLSYITLTILAIITLFVSGFFGLLVLTISTLTGIYCIQLKVRRTTMMGCLMLPVILLYLF